MLDQIQDIEKGRPLPDNSGKCDECNQMNVIFILSDGGARYHLCKGCYIETSKAMLRDIEAKLALVEGRAI